MHAILLAKATITSIRGLRASIRPYGLFNGCSDTSGQNCVLRRTIKMFCV